MIECVVIVWLLIMLLWATIVINNGKKTIELMNKLNKTPQYVEFYNKHKKLAEEFNGVCKRKIDDPVKLMSKHLKWNTIVFYCLNFFACLGIYNVDENVVFWACWLGVSMLYIVHLVYVEYYNQDNQKFYNIFYNKKLKDCET